MKKHTVSVSRSKFIELARLGYPCHAIVQLGLPDVPAIAPPNYFVRKDDSGTILGLVAWMLCPTSSQDTNMVIDTRARKMQNDFCDSHGVTNTITAEGFSFSSQGRTPETPFR